MPGHSVASIQALSPRDRKKLTTDDLLDVIMNIDASIFDTTQKNISSLQNDVSTLIATVQILKQDSQKNTADFINVIEKNKTLEEDNLKLKEQVNILRQELYVTRDDVVVLRTDLDEINQYLRVNNIEIVGLPSPDENSNDENLVVDFINNNLGYELKADDIDICHEIPSRRKDKKRVVICKFVRRKSKYDILAAKKIKPKITISDNEIFINEHFSPSNRRLFAIASEKKRQCEYKFLWSRNGQIYLRKNDSSEVIHVSDNNIDGIF